MNNVEHTIASLVQMIRHQGIDEVDAAINAVSDSFNPSDEAESLMNESILDGIRWGHRCGVTVERLGGTTLRIRSPGGAAITHEFYGQTSPDEMARAITRGTAIDE